MATFSPEVPESLQTVANKEARRDGMFAGLTAGLSGALLGSKLLRFNRNQTIICGVLTGVLSGYFFTQAFLSSRLAVLKKNLAQQPLDHQPQQQQMDASWSSDG
ncbi:hypothetical protein EDC04DRAFT_2791052 [Pisolithus marmoratus]|nr:hypothetical protein EDC04DRAFT_2791052 [Pisolithus marmoratus]